MDVDDLIAYDRGKKGQVDWGNQHSVRGWQESQINAPVFGADPSRAHGVLPARTKRILTIVGLTLLIGFILVVWIGRARQQTNASTSSASTGVPIPASIAWRDGTDISSTTLKLMGLKTVTQLIEQPYRHASIDLNGDGRPETIIQTANCAANACETLIVETRGATSSLVSVATLPHDVIVSSAMHDGFHVLAPASSGR